MGFNSNLGLDILLHQFHLLHKGGPMVPKILFLGSAILTFQN